jgi:hypothetical protein
MVAALAGAGQGFRIAAAARARFNIVPVSHVARSVLALARCPDSAGGTFHLVVTDPPSQDAMLRMIAGRLGARGLELVEGSARAASGASTLERRFHLRLERYRDYLDRDVHFDDTQARRALARLGLAPATLAGPDVGRLIDHALREARPPGPLARRVRAAGATATAPGRVR